MKSISICCLARRLPLYVSLIAVLSHQPPSVLAAEVQNCGDGGPGSGSLRDVIANAAPGDTVDLSQLPVKCGMFNSVITLSSGEIDIAQDDLQLEGPVIGTVTIKAAPENDDARVFNHYGVGLLVIEDLMVEGGKVYRPGALAEGGCIASLGSAFLVRTSVKGCAVSGSYGVGGGVYTSGSLALLASTISSNSAYGSQAGKGGGVFARASLTLVDSTISGNTATAVGGGAYVYLNGGGSASVAYSTIDHNAARYCGGAALQVSSKVSNTTVSYNTAVNGSYGGLCFFDGQSAIANSTVVFNLATNETGGVGVKLGSIDLQSTIIALNDSTLGATDLYVNQAAVSGSDNLIVSASNVPANVIKLTSDPQVGPLRYNGGLTLTHALLPGSPAIGAGNSNVFSWWDQRGKGYPRATGGSPATDIGAFQFDSIFFDDFETVPF
jgi:hypothetical protein